jgi:Domain of unknown function (DUF1902)
MVRAIFFEEENLEMPPTDALSYLQGVPPKPIDVEAAWDDEAKVWFITHSTLPGLHLEAETPTELYNKLPGAIEDLLEGTGEQEVSFSFWAPFKAAGHVKIAA